MKKFTFKGVLDGFRSTVQAQSCKPEQEIQETLRSDYFLVKKTFRHGFPHSPTALAYDPVQKLLVIGDKSGSLRILGRPGVDIHVRHEGDSACAVLQIEFLVNEGALVTATADDTLHLWNFRQKFPQVVQSLKFQRERITSLHLPVGSKWLYVGTEKGNIHVVHIESFALSGYIINWNKAIDVIRKTHPGAVISLCDNPLDANRLLIAFESGQIVLWDMRGKCAEIRWQSAEPLRSIAWHHEGKHFISSHTDGSLCTWPLRPSLKPQFHSYPHAKTNKEGKLEACKPIHKVDMRTSRNDETLTIFSGGLSMEKGGKSPCITVLQGKSTTVLEMEHPVVDFVTICESPWPSDMQEPYAIAVLLQNDLVLIDLLSSGFPCFESPYPMDVHESPVTCCTYLADCPSDLVPAFYSVGRSASSRRTGFSDREWPVSGGEWSPASCSYSEIIITGHQDGSVKFWDASAGTLQILYKLKTGKLFERPRTRSVDSSEDDPLAIQIISLCAESRRLCVAGASGHVILFKFRKLEGTGEILVLEIPITYENFDEGETSPDCEFVPRSLPKQPDSGDSEKRNDGMLRVRPGPQRKPPGFQAQLICLTPWTNGTHPGQITSLTINSSYGLMAYGNEYGLAIVDIMQKICLLNVASPDLYGANDPYSRVPKSPKRGDNPQCKEEQARSPSIDQLPDLSSSPQKVSLLPSSLPSETITSISATTVTASNATHHSMNLLAAASSAVSLSTTPSSSRPISPSCEALENMNSNNDNSNNNSNNPSNSSSAAISPNTTEISEIITPEENLKLQTVGTARRRSSAWKTFNLKRQLSKVITKNTSTAAGTSASSGGTGGVGEYNATAGAPNKSRGSIFYCAPTEGTPLSPVEISPDSNSVSSPTLTDNEQDKFDYLEQMGKDVDNILNDLRNDKNDDDSDPIKDSLESAVEELIITPNENVPCIDENNPESTEIASQSKVNFTQNIPRGGSMFTQQHQEQIRTRGKKERTMSQPQAVMKRVDFATADEQPIARSFAPNVEGGKMSRPSNLPLFSDDNNAENENIDEYGNNSGHQQPTVPPRLKKKEKRNERLLSVPNIKYQMRDLRSRSAKSEHGSTFAGSLIRRFSRVDKLDSSFSRSRSSSMSSLENISSEAITCLAFTDSYTKKSDPSTLIPTLWVGTSLGSVLTVSISLSDADSRKTQPVIVSILGGPIFRLKGSILTMSFLDCNGALIPYSYEPWKDDGKRERTPTKNANRMSPTLTGTTGTSSSGSGSSDNYSDRQFIVIASEKQARVVALPSQNCVYRLQITETDFVVKAEVISMRDSVCMIAYVSNGHLMAYSLPSLRPLVDVDFLPLNDLRIAKTFCFSNRGHGLYLATPTEIQKFSICAEFGQFYSEMLGELFVANEMPEAPKESFFKGLFGGGAKSLDREELFGEQSGKANRSVAKHIPGPSLEQLGQRSSTAASEISRAHQLAMERGDKLNVLEERAEKMSNQAQEFSGTAHQLMMKYRDKKWYQL